MSDVELFSNLIIRHFGVNVCYFLLIIIVLTWQWCQPYLGDFETRRDFGVFQECSILVDTTSKKAKKNNLPEVHKHL